MNIFILDTDLETCARYHCDEHVNKMILESAQMACDVLRRYGHTELPYKVCNPNHPCTKWAGDSIQNFIYLCDYAYYLNEEAKRRYNKVIDHKSWLVIQSLPFPDAPDIGLTPFARAFKKYSDCMAIKDIVEAYRAFYVKDKQFAGYRYSARPEWFNGSSQT